MTSPSDAYIAVGLGFGDEGKGSIVDYLVRRHNAGMVVRYNGGAQAAHHVVSTDGREHTFAQFGAGTFVPGCRTHLSEYVVVNPLNLLRENDVLKEIGVTDALKRLTIDGQALIVTPWHIAVNRATEASRRWRRHGSCGQGIGDARADFLDGDKPFLIAATLTSRSKTLKKLREIRDYKIEQLRAIGPDWAPEFEAMQHPKMPEAFTEHYLRLRFNIVAWKPPNYGGNIVYEGAQGVLLDEARGFHPHHTWTDTTTGNAHRLLDRFGHVGERHTIGVTRAYMTRHGDGPFPTENTTLTKILRDTANDTSLWQGSFRVGFPDLMLLRYALKVCPVDSLAVTCMDRLREIPGSTPWKAAINYNVDGHNLWGQINPPASPTSPLAGRALQRAEAVYQPLGRTAKAYAEVLPAPVRIWSYSPAASGKVEADAE